MTPSEALQALAQAAVEFDATDPLRDGERQFWKRYGDLIAACRQYARTQEQPHG